MAKDDRSALNPFTGKEHYDKVNDDKFLEDPSRKDLRERKYSS